MGSNNKVRRKGIFLRFLPLIVFFITFGSVMALTSLPVLADDYDVDLQDAMEGSVPNFSATVTGSGLSYYGDSLQVFFTNNTTQELRVRIPIGLRLIPTDSGVQTMYTAGGEVLVVPPGASSSIFKGFCGEMHDHAPSSSDTFSPGGFASGELMQTLRNINDEGAYNFTGQTAIWNRTDSLDVSGDEDAQRLSGSNRVDGGKAAAAGVAGAAAAGATSVLMNRQGTGGTSTEVSGDGGRPTTEHPGGEPGGQPEDYEEPEGDEDTPPPERDDSSEGGEEGPEELEEQAPPEGEDTEPVRYKEPVRETAAVTQLIDPETGRPLPVNDDGKVLYGKDWITPEEAAEKIAMDQEWLQGRQRAEEAVDQFKKTLQEYNNTDPDARTKVEEYRDLERKFFKSEDPAERAALQEQLRQQRAEIDGDDAARQAFELDQSLRDQAIRGNESYDMKSIMKREGAIEGTDATRAFDRAVLDSYGEVDQKFIDKLNEMGFRRGGRPFTQDDLQSYRNASSAGKPSMDRDYGLNEAKVRDLMERLNNAEPGSAEAQDIARQLAAEHAATKITVDPDKYASHLRREIVETNSQLERLRGELENAPRGSAEAERLNAEIERLSGRPDQLQSELNRIEAQAARVKDSYIKDLETRLSRATPGSPEAQRLTAELSDAQMRFAGKAEIDLSPSRWHDGADGVYKRTFSDVTRTDPEKAFQCLTHSKHKEAYADMAVLRGDPANPAMAEQTTSVSRIKEIENNGLVEEGKLTRGQAIQETARGYEKDIRTKVEPQMSNDPNVPKEKLDMVKKIREVFDKVGKGEIRPGEADSYLREAVPEIKDINMEKATRIIDANYESSMKYQGTGSGGEPPRITDTEGALRTGAGAGTQVDRVADTESGLRTGGTGEGTQVERTPDTERVEGSSLTGRAFSKVSDLAVTENYYKQNLAQGMGHGEALSVATAQTAAGNAAQMSGVADPRISMAAGSLLPNGMNNMLPDQAIENWTGTSYQAGKAGLESLRDSFSSGQLNTEAIDKFAENVANRSGNDPFKGIAQLSELAGEEFSRTDGGNIVSDLKNIYDTGAGSEVLNESMQEFQQSIAAGKPGDRMVALQGWDHLSRSVSEVIVDPIHEAESLVSDMGNMLKYGVGDEFWSDSWEHTKGVLQDTPLVGQVIKGYNEIAAGIGESGVVGFAEEMYEGGAALAGEAAEYVADSASSAYDYIKSLF